MSLFYINKFETYTYIHTTQNNNILGIGALLNKKLAVSAAIVTPLDVVKVRLQSQIWDPLVKVATELHLLY